MSNWTGKRVLIIGAARQGQALARYLDHEGAQVILNDKRTGKEMDEIRSAFARTNGKLVFVDHGTVREG